MREIGIDVRVNDEEDCRHVKEQLKLAFGKKDSKVAVYLVEI